MLSRLLNRYPLSTLRPGMDLAVIGDVHGCASLLEMALERAGDAQVVCVGDYVDRGPDSAEVLRILRDHPDVLCIGGNHEEMLLRFVDEPEQNGAAWLRHGGMTTLESFGINQAAQAETPAALANLRDALVAAMGDEVIGWLRELPDYWVFGNVAVVHAAADPKLPMEQQTSRSMRWGHNAFRHVRRKDGLWVVHGHVVVPQAEVHQGRIAIDSGAYATGRLTLAHLRDGNVSFEVFNSR